MAEEIEIRRSEEDHRYEALLDGRVAGVAVFRANGAVVNFLHTEVDPDFEGRGVGSRLVGGALADVRERGERARPHCPFVATYIRRHPEFRDLVDERDLHMLDSAPGG